MSVQVTNALDGTFGMALSATPGYVSPFRALVLAGEISNSFSMCLSTTGGALVLGGFDTQYTLVRGGQRREGGRGSAICCSCMMACRSSSNGLLRLASFETGFACGV